MVQEEIRILRDIYRQANKSIRSIERIRMHSGDMQLRNWLSSQREEYQQIAYTAERLLKGRGYGYVRKMSLPTAYTLPMSEQRMVQHRLRDCADSMEKSIQILNCHPVDPKISSLGRRLLLSQQAESARIRQYLS